MLTKRTERKERRSLAGELLTEDCRLDRRSFLCRSGLAAGSLATLGTLSLALRSLVDSGSSIPDSPIEGVKARTESRTSVNMVRFGITTTAHTR